MALVLIHPAITAAQGQAKKEDLPIADSKFLMHVSYDSQSLQMTVTMKNGAQYIHFYVYPAIMEQFKQARSKGEFYANQIRGKHPSTRVISKAVGKKISKTKKQEIPNDGRNSRS